jgi:DNA polymerase-4
MFDKFWPQGKPVRLIGVGAAQLTSEPVQLNLLETNENKEEKLLRSVDELRERFGSTIVQRGYEIRKD